MATNRWQAWLGEGELDWQNRPWTTGSFYLDFENQGENKPLEITASSLDLAMLHDVVNDLLRLPEAAALALEDLSPEGELVNVKISSDLSGNFAGGFLLEANLQDVAVDAVQTQRIVAHGRPLGATEVVGENDVAALAEHDVEIQFQR